METLSFQDLVTRGELPSIPQITGVHGSDCVIKRDANKSVIGCGDHDGQPIVIARHGRNFQIRCAALIGELTSLGEGVFCGYDSKNGVPCPLVSRFRAIPLDSIL